MALDFDLLVIGSGPAGLSAAYHLVRRGHAVTIRDSAPALGGMMRYGIPAYRLPRDVLDAEVARVIDLGVAVELDTPVTDLDAAVAEGARVIVRPSGTEPKVKCYLEVVVPVEDGVEDGVDAARISAAGRLDAIKADLRTSAFGG